MIQYNELQPGNLAFFGNEKVMIQSIHSTIKRTDVDFKRYNIFQKLEECCTTIKKLAFIPLNKNIMEQLDFESMIDKEKKTTYYGYKIDKELDISFFIKEYEGEFEFFSDRTGFKKISNVHELQNLFFLKKDYELPINKLLDFK